MPTATSRPGRCRICHPSRNWGWRSPDCNGATIQDLILDDWEKEWGENPQRNEQPKLLLVDFRSPLVAIKQWNVFIVTT
jgi:hypothetical protein